MTQYVCAAHRRLLAVKTRTTVNGIEYLEVRDSEEPQQELRQRTLYVRLLQPPATPLAVTNVRIEGGERITRVDVEWVAMADTLLPDPLVADLDEPDHVLVVRTAGRGDRSLYRFRLVAGVTDDHAPAGFDPQLTEVEFSFAVECASDLDCETDCACPPEQPAEIDIDYLAKDFQGFRRVMLERMSLLAPGWTERNPADVGVTLVELLAYVADGLSYRQDAIATEAYLGTARSRVSVRRHARMVDYLVHDGCNARTWLRFDVSAPLTLPAGTPVLSRVPTAPPQLDPGSGEHTTALASRPVQFETMHDGRLDPGLAELAFWTWGEQHCCLPAGATAATIVGRPPLQPGDVVLLVQTVSPVTGNPADADHTLRWAVRLTDVESSVDEVGGLFTDAGSGPVEVTELTWAVADALPFALPLGTDDEDAPAAVWGNLVAADHGATITGEQLGTTLEGVRFRPVLAQRPVTSVTAYVPAGSAAAVLVQDPRAALPAVSLRTDPPTDTWDVRRDLLDDGADDRVFVVEAEDDTTAAVRFGDDRHGAQPVPGLAFVADYRVGNGAAGNVGADALAHVVTTNTSVLGVTNPLAASGGTEPETIDEVRRDAPQAFTRQDRAVTAADYADKALGSDVTQATATFRWTGSWHTVFVTADRPGGIAVDDPFEQSLRARLERYRMAGYDLEVDSPAYVPLEIALLVCVAPDRFRSDVGQAVLEVLGSGLRPDGRPALFNPDRFTFGQPVHLSSVYAAVHAVPGVESVTVTRFQRQREPATSGLDTGVLPMGRLEIARLDNDPSFPDRGVLTLTTGGGA